jgi:hypothetical protein
LYCFVAARRRKIKMAVFILSVFLIECEFNSAKQHDRTFECRSDISFLFTQRP